MKPELYTVPLDSWLPSAKRPFIVSGPCAAETEEQMLDTAAGLAKLNTVSIFRSGIWKPRTRPNLFEGVGSVGLKWLKEVKKQYGFLTTVEVANVRHVEEALKNDVDILWIGARTTVSPFSVQEIADALSGIDIPVMVKNPVHPDLEVWIGALERINQAGIHKLIAVHRGFYTGEKDSYRNTPHWEIPMELRTRFPHLPVICDPSHICGNRKLLPEVAQKALDFHFDGLMIESHVDPVNALSDKNQQLKPAELGELLNSLILPTELLNDRIAK
jgi:chorismate mutase